MSLDFYISVPREHFYTRENGSTVAYPLEDGQCGELHVGNITHNLNTMAENVPVSDTLDLYKVLWRPDENNLLLTDEIWPLVEEGINPVIRYGLNLALEDRCFDEDMIQDVCLIIWGKILAEEIRKPGSLGAFTISTCRYYVSNLMRKMRGRKRIEDKLATLMKEYGKARI